VDELKRQQTLAQVAAAEPGYISLSPLSLSLYLCLSVVASAAVFVAQT